MSAAASPGFFARSSRSTIRPTARGSSGRACRTGSGSCAGRRGSSTSNVIVHELTAAFADVSGAADITFVHAANAIAAFETVNWRSDNSPFDRYLRGNKAAMSTSAKRGMRVVYSAAPFDVRAAQAVLPLARARLTAGTRSSGLSTSSP